MIEEHFLLVTGWRVRNPGKPGKRKKCRRFGVPIAGPGFKVNSFKTVIKVIDGVLSS